MDASSGISKPDPFAKNLLDWRDELLDVQPAIPRPEHDYCKQPISDKKVKQNREKSTKSWIINRIEIESK